MIRVMEVILAPNTGYMALTSAMFALGLGGIYLYLFPVPSQNIGKVLGRLCIGFAVFAPAVILIFNFLPFGFEINKANLLIQVACWSGMYLTLILPFFVAGMVLALVFQTYSKSIDRLYFYDLVAAGVACLILIPLLPSYGPGGMIFIASGAAIVAFLAFYRPTVPVAILFSGIAAAMVVIPLTVDGYIEFKGHANKRQNDQFVAEGKRLFVKWDPVSKLEIFDYVQPNALLFSLDGGSQGSWLRRFRGDFTVFAKEMKKSPDSFFFGRNSLAHYFMDVQGIEPEVLVIGSAAGADVKAALALGAKHVDAIELVDAMVSAVKTEYNEYGGGVYTHPKVSAIAGEGRSFLRASKKRYDIIQMFSNHSSSSITSGAMAAGVAYLQTVEAYREYFDHLTERGMIQINHHIYPRMLTTAAQAWNSSGRSEFWKHVLVIEPTVPDTLPTFFIKMQPWTAAQVETITEYVNRRKVYVWDRKPPAKPSPRIFGDQVYQGNIISRRELINGLQVLVGTYDQDGLDYDVELELLDENGGSLSKRVIEGRSVMNNSWLDVTFPDIPGVSDKHFGIRVSAPDANEQNGISVWLDKQGQAVFNFLPPRKADSSFVAFHPLEPKNNIVTNDMLVTPFPYTKAATLPWDITPVSDYSPYFGMIRKEVRLIEAGKENMLDNNTAALLNTQLKDGYPKDWIHLIVVAVVSVVFSLLFVVIPLFRTNLRHTAWSGMSRDLVYFACLGLGFIMIEVVLIQLFNKLIGFPVHTFVLVISTMLLSAGFGSMASRKFLRLINNRVYWVFVIIFVYGMLFTFLFEDLFYALLGFSLPVRMLCGMMMIAPLGFFLGMPFPIGILGLSDTNETAISWAWALNGFFTVLGGYLAIIVSIMTSFKVVLSIAILIYICALLVVRRRIPELQPAPVLDKAASVTANAT